MSDVLLERKDDEKVIDRKDDLSFEKVGTVGGSLIGLDIGRDYGWNLSPIHGETFSEMALNTGLYMLVTIGGSLVGGTVGKLAGRGIDTARRKLK